jgi:ribosomal protein S18 acetylase RimI-like enzyme
MTRRCAISAAAMTALERHETSSHAIPSREVRDLGDAVVLHDPLDADPFWNRAAAVRWPADAAAFDRRLAEAMTLFGLLGRLPHVWPSPVHAGPPDLVSRLEANGFADVGGGHVMVLADPARAAGVTESEAEVGVSLRAIRRLSDAGPRDLADAGAVLAAAFGAPATRGPELAADLAATADDPRIVLVVARVHGTAAAVAKATTFDGLTYLSSIGTLPGFRGRGLGGLVTRHALTAAGAQAPGSAYLGVFSGNATAIALYERLGFASVGESPDLLLE